MRLRTPNTGFKQRVSDWNAAPAPPGDELVCAARHQSEEAGEPAAAQLADLTWFNPYSAKPLTAFLLRQAMSVFALRDINMKKLESRPLRSSPILHELDNGRRSYNYVFFIDFIGSTAEVRCASTHPWVKLAYQISVK